MPGGQPQVLSSRFRGLNRLLASYMLDPAESPDTADAGQYGNVSQVLGPRGGRKPIQALSFPIKGVVPLNLSWLKLQLIATADGSITPYVITDPLFFNDVGAMIAYDPTTKFSVSALNGWYPDPGSAHVNPSPWNFVSNTLITKTGPSFNLDGPVDLRLNFSGPSANPNISVLAQNTGTGDYSFTSSIFATAYNAANQSINTISFTGAVLTAGNSATQTPSSPLSNLFPCAYVLLSVAGSAIGTTGTQAAQWTFTFTP